MFFFLHWQWGYSICFKMLKNKLRCSWLTRKKRRDYFVNDDYKQRQKIKTREINHDKHKRDIDKIQELIMLLQDLFLTILHLRP